MTLLQKKVDAIARSLLANDTTDRNAALADLAVLMKKPQNCADGAAEIARNLLFELGVPEHLLGSRYLIKAIELAVQDKRIIDAMQKGLYPAVAQCFDTTGSRAERAIRHAIEVSWDRGDMDVLQRYFGFTVSSIKGKPTNSEFIARCMNIVRERIGRE
ncbi:MAG: sporulation initiation factor Spo0A C-terminal domain-containing protein [Oscillospiraceae bacterium]|nr:sporulation initiation factor Spo0A C-terminal domain-containing protein [Oscillospiraceae bacterium]